MRFFSADSVSDRRLGCPESEFRVLKRPGHESFAVQNEQIIPVHGIKVVERIRNDTKKSVYMNVVDINVLIKCRDISSRLCKNA